MGKRVTKKAAIAQEQYTAWTISAEELNRAVAALRIQLVRTPKRAKTKLTAKQVKNVQDLQDSIVFNPAVAAKKFSLP